MIVPRVRDERGSAAVEAVVVAPAVVLLIGLVIFGGRVALTHQTVQNIAADTARAASLERTTSRARNAATKAMDAAVAQQLPCETHHLNLDLDGFEKPPGTPASVSATITCQLPTAELALPGLPGSIIIRATMTSPLDTYRERR